MTLQGLNDVKHWRDRAAEMRVLSGEMKDFDAQTLMLKLANDYDELADRAEDRAARNVPGRPSPTTESPLTAHRVTLLQTAGAWLKLAEPRANRKPSAVRPVRLTQLRKLGVIHRNAARDSRGAGVPL